MDLLLKISVLQAIFCWLGDLEKLIYPWKERVEGKKIIQVVFWDLVCRNATSPSFELGKILSNPRFGRIYLLAKRLYHAQRR